jgi:hypothetical protein
LPAFFVAAASVVFVLASDEAALLLLAFAVGALPSPSKPDEAVWASALAEKILSAHAAHTSAVIPKIQLKQLFECTS